MTTITPRLRNLRTTPRMRTLFQETQLALSHLIQPYFIVNDAAVFQESAPHSGLFHVGAARIVDEVRPLYERGLGAIMLFGVSETKQERHFDWALQLKALSQSIKALKQAMPDLVIMADVCLCAYTTHGHCGVTRASDASQSGVIDNDESVTELVNMALSLADSGADFVCPSDMMDGRVAAIRTALDQKGHSRVSIMAYSAKMASVFYGPFRHAAHSAPSFGDRKSYQMPVANRREALRELQQDEAEGADVLLIKPAMTNLDLIRDAREQSLLPLCAYQVSGEYMMIELAAQAGAFDRDRAILESLTAIRRAGADLIVTYFARTLTHILPQ